MLEVINNSPHLSQKYPSIATIKGINKIITFDAKKVRLSYLPIQPYLSPFNSTSKTLSPFFNPLTTSHSIQVYLHSFKIHLTLLQYPHTSLLPPSLILHVYITPSNINYEYGITLDCINTAHYILSYRHIVT